MDEREERKNDMDNIHASRACTDYKRRPQFGNKQYSASHKSSQYPKSQFKPKQYSTYRSEQPVKMECWKCMAQKRPYNHDIARCDYISRAELRTLVRSCRVETGEEEDDSLDYNMDELHIDEQQE